MDFTPFGFADAIHFLMFWGSGFDFDAKISACGDEFGRGECCACIGSDESYRLCAAKELGLSKP